MVMKIFSGFKKSKSKKIMSGIAASMMLFSACPKETFNNKVCAMEDGGRDSKTDWLTIGVTAGVLAVVGIVGGIIAYFENKAWQEELAARDRLLYGANDYIKNLAKNLKTIIPRRYSNLFRSLVECKNRFDLLNWQGTIPSGMGISNLRKVKDCLYSHWSIWEPANAYSNIYMLEKMCDDLVSDERFDKSVELEREKIDAKKNQKKIINQVNNTHIDNSRTNINNTNFDYSNNYNTSYNTNNQYDTNYNTNYNTDYNYNTNYNSNYNSSYNNYNNNGYYNGGYGY